MPVPVRERRTSREAIDTTMRPMMHNEILELLVESYDSFDTSVCAVYLRNGSGHKTHPNTFSHMRYSDQRERPPSVQECPGHLPM